MLRRSAFSSGRAAEQRDIGKGPRGCAAPSLGLPKDLCGNEPARVWAGEREGAAARLAWNQMPGAPCCARRSASEARTFPPRSGGKVTAFLKAVAKVPELLRPHGGRGRAFARPLPCVCSMGEKRRRGRRVTPPSGAPGRGHPAPPPGPS